MKEIKLTLGEIKEALDKLIDEVGSKRYQEDYKQGKFHAEMDKENEIERTRHDATSKLQ